MRREKGFTLIELLVVVVVVALLAIVLVVIKSRSRRYISSHVPHCGANLNAIGKGILLYQAENNDEAPGSKAAAGHRPPERTPRAKPNPPPSAQLH